MYQGLAITEKRIPEIIYFLNIDGKLIPHRADGTVVKFFALDVKDYETKYIERLNYKRNRYRRMMTYRRLRLEGEVK